MPQIAAVRTKDDSSRDSIAVVLSQDAICLGPDGQPWSGVALSAQLARSLAERLLGLAREIEHQERSEKQEPSHSLSEITSIFVLHEGSGQGHRAFELALDLALRSLAFIQLIGVYGVQQHADRFGPSSTTADYEWQRAWLSRLFQMYAQKAEQGNIRLQTQLVAADDYQMLSAVLDGSEFDLIVLPRRFSEHAASDNVLSAFHQSLAGATQSTILFCP